MTKDADALRSACRTRTRVRRSRHQLGGLAHPTGRRFFTQRSSGGRLNKREIVIVIIFLVAYTLLWLLAIYVLESTIDYFSDVIAIPTTPFL